MMNSSASFDIVITFMHARGLPVGDISGSSDPYIIATVNNDLKYRTKTILANLNPVWNEEWWLGNVPMGAKFEIGVWDYDFMKRDDTIGSVSCVFNGEIGEWVRDLDVIYNGKMHGILTIKMNVRVSQSPGPLRSTGPVTYEKHSSYMAGALTQTTEDTALAYSVYKIRLPYVKSCFRNQTQKWNHKYRQAQMIFTQMPQGIIARKIIHSLYESLYRPSATSKYGVLNSGKDFLQLFNYGQRGGYNRFYTYVISDDTMRFSETGAPFFTDFMSKHAMHANCAKEVYYSGEFCVSQTGSSYTLYIDNNSGTYAPNKADLPNLAACMRQNFPDLAVEAVDREDPLLKALKRKTPMPPIGAANNPMQSYQQYFDPNILSSNPQQQPNTPTGGSFPLQTPDQLLTLHNQQQAPLVQAPSVFPHQIFFSPNNNNVAPPQQVVYQPSPLHPQQNNLGYPPPPSNNTQPYSPPFPPQYHLSSPQAPHYPVSPPPPHQSPSFPHVASFPPPQRYPLPPYQSPQFHHSPSYPNNTNNPVQYRPPPLPYPPSQSPPFSPSQPYPPINQGQSYAQSPPPYPPQNYPPSPSLPSSPPLYPNPAVQISGSSSQSKMLQRGEIFPVEFSLLRIGFGWEIIPPNNPSVYPVELDGTTFSLNRDGRIRASADMTFYNNRQSTDGSVYNHGGNLVSFYEGDLEQISVDLKRVDPEVLTIVFALAVYDADERGMNFASIRNPFIRISDSRTNEEKCRFYFTENGSPFQTVIMGKLCLQNFKWYFQTEGNGMPAIKKVAGMFGVNTM